MIFPFFYIFLEKINNFFCRFFPSERFIWKIMMEFSISFFFFFQERVEEKQRFFWWTWGWRWGNFLLARGRFWAGKIEETFP
jgi:hypothetical protein